MRIALIKSFTDKPWRSPQTYDRIEKCLRERWQVESVAAGDEGELERFLLGLGHKEDIFVFNIAEYLNEREKTGFIPALLDGWGLRHLGSSAEIIAIGLDKASTKAALRQAGVPTPADFVATAALSDKDMIAAANAIGFPLIVKPTLEGGHIGIGADSIASDGQSLVGAVRKILSRHKQPALVETYIGGDGMREFSVGVIDGLDGRIFTPVEIDYAAMDVDVPILSYESAQKDLERIKLVSDPLMRKRVEALASETFDAVGAADYARVDMRMDRRECYVLEINLMPGLGPHSFLPEAAKDIHGLDYCQLVSNLAAASMERKMPPLR